MTDSLTFPDLPGVLRRCSPVIVREDADDRDSTTPWDCKGVIVAVSDEWTGDGCLVALEDGCNTVEWSGKVPAWTLALDLADPTGVDHLRDWLAARVLRGRRTPPIGSVWYYAGCWRLRVSVGKHWGYEVFTFGRWRGCDYTVPGLTAKLKPAEALRLCALHVAREKGLLPSHSGLKP